MSEKCAKGIWRTWQTPQGMAGRETPCGRTAKYAFGGRHLCGTHYPPLQDTLGEIRGKRRLLKNPFFIRTGKTGKLQAEIESLQARAAEIRAGKGTRI